MDTMSPDPPKPACAQRGADETARPPSASPPQSLGEEGSGGVRKITERSCSRSRQLREEKDQEGGGVGYSS